MRHICYTDSHNVILLKKKAHFKLFTLLSFGDTSLKAALDYYFFHSADFLSSVSDEMQHFCFSAVTLTLKISFFLYIYISKLVLVFATLSDSRHMYRLYFYIK